MANNVVTQLQGQLQNARQVLAGTMEGVTAEQAHWTPPGKANPLGATYVHIVTSEDALVNAMIKGAAPLFASSWAGKVGISEPPPGPTSEGLPDWSGWARQVQVDLSAAREYAQAVGASVDEYLSSLSDEDMGRSLDLSGIGLGEMTVGQLLSTVVANTHWHTGEISCLKGLQGLKGYPF